MTLRTDELNDVERNFPIIFFTVNLEVINQ